MSFLGNFLKILGTFRFQHLVTLHGIHNENKLPLPKVSSFFTCSYSSCSCFCNQCNQTLGKTRSRNSYLATSSWNLHLLEISMAGSYTPPQPTQIIMLCISRVSLHEFCLYNAQRFWFECLESVVQLSQYFWQKIIRPLKCAFRKASCV